MPEEVVYWVTKYGYLAIFVLVFLQEVGMPNPFPNELLLIFSGYLSVRGLLFFPYVIVTAVVADFLGTNTLYFLFYNAGSYIINKKPKWIPLSSAMIERLSLKVSKGGKLTMFIFRLTPFTRGYTSVIAGLLNVGPRLYLPLAMFSAVIWATLYVLTGYFIGPYWDLLVEHIDGFKYIMLGILFIIVALVLLVNFLRRKKVVRTNTYC